MGLCAQHHLSLESHLAGSHPVEYKVEQEIDGLCPLSGWRVSASTQTLKSFSVSKLSRVSVSL